MSARSAARPRRGFALALFLLLGVLATSSPAWARGTVQVLNNPAQESSGAWKLKFKIDYGSVPDLATVPMTLEFTPKAIYERSLTDESGDKPIERRVPITNGTAINVPVDVSFSNVQGQKFRVTKFSIKLRRDNDFEAGEYELVVKTRRGRMGRPILLKLQGKNKVINRKSIEFTAKPKPKKEGSGDAADEAPVDEGPVASEDMGPDLSDIPDISDEEAEAALAQDAPPPVEPKQGGCGCEVVGTPVPGRWGALLALTLGAAVSLRRRRGR